MPQEQTSVIASLIGGLFLFVIILFLAWFCTKWLGTHYGVPSKVSKIKILERCAIGTDRSLMIVRVGEKVWLLGVTAHNINIITELNSEDFAQEEYDIKGSFVQSQKFTSDFSRILKDAFDKKNNNSEKDK